MKIILSTSPRSEADIERKGLPFLGIGYIASYIEKNSGHQVEIFDTHTDNLTPFEAAEKILEKKPDIVGIHAITNNRFKTIELAKELKKKKPGVIIVVGGPHFSLTSKNALEIVSEIDYVIRGEGEIAMLELLNAIEAGGDKNKINGLSFRDAGGNIIENHSRPLILNLDDLPNPAWHLFGLEKYTKPIDGTNIKAIGVLSGRGCPNICVFCCNAVYERAMLRLRSPKKFVDEVEMLYKDYGYKGFDFWDDTMTIVKQHVREVCEEIMKRKLDIVWYARARVNTVDQDLLHFMRKAGCVRISYGIESGSPKVLKVIKKNITLDQARSAVRASYNAGMKVMLNFMVNLPEETMDDLKQTVAFMKEMRKMKGIFATYGFSLIYPGIEMEKMAREQGIFPPNFSWNSPYKSEKYKIAGIDPSMPYMEWPGKEIEKVKAFMARELSSPSDMLMKGLKKFKGIKSWGELRELIKTGARYISRY